MGLEPAFIAVGMGGRRFGEAAAMDPALQGVLASAFVDGAGVDFRLMDRSVPRFHPFPDGEGELGRGQQIGGDQAQDRGAAQGFPRKRSGPDHAFKIDPAPANANCRTKVRTVISSSA
jgi:hypothetical protein